MFGIEMKDHAGREALLYCGDEIRLRLSAGFLYLSAYRNHEPLLLGRGKGSKEINIAMILGPVAEAQVNMHLVSNLLAGLLMEGGFATDKLLYNDHAVIVVY